MATLRHDIESTLGCAIFPVVYFAVLALSIHLTILNATGSAARHSQEASNAYAVEVTVLAALIASLAHVLALGWMRERDPAMSLRMFVLLQIVIALLSAVMFLVVRLWLFGAAVWLGPAAVTLGVYALALRRRTPHGR